MNVVKTYGVSFTSPGINKFYLRHKSNGSCVFLYNYYGKGFCSLQHMKPQACKLWPFKVLSRPKYGRAKEAEYNYAGRQLFIYVDPSCTGLTWGNPTTNFMKTTLTEFIELALGMRKKQVYSTSQILYYPRYLKPKRQKVF
jgi:Fe-S-cluster containining protein